MIYRAYFDRSLGSISGVFTLQGTEDGFTREYVAKKHPARSGQNGKTSGKYDWVSGSGAPIPFGRYELYTKGIQIGQDPGLSGVGEFHAISNTEDPNKMVGKAPNQFRLSIGLHPENGYPGSMGCVVLLKDTAERKATVAKVFKKLGELHAQGVETIEFIVL